MQVDHSELHPPVDRELEGGIEWIVARQLAPIEDELERLRAQLDALRGLMPPWAVRTVGPRRRSAPENAGFLVEIGGHDLVIG